MNVKLPVLAGGVALTAAAILIGGSPASAGPGLTQGASAKLALPATQSATIITDCENGSCREITTPHLNAQALGIDVTYTLLNASSLPDVLSFTGKPLVTSDACNGRTGVSLTISGSNLGSTKGTVSVNGQPVGEDRAAPSPSQGGYSRSVCLPL